MLSSKLYWPGDWIYAARSCLSRCTLEIPSVYSDSLYPRCFSKGQTTFLLCMLRKQLAGRAYKFYKVMVMSAVCFQASCFRHFSPHAGKWSMTSRKTDEGIKWICINRRKFLWRICEFMKRSICLSNLSGQYNVLRWCIKRLHLLATGAREVFWQDTIDAQKRL